MTDETQAALKQRGIDKLLDEAREDNKENDARLTVPKSMCMLLAKYFDKLLTKLQDDLHDTF